MNEDLEHLRLLSIFYYLVALFVGLLSLVPVLHLAMGILMITGGDLFKPDPPPAFVGWLVSCFAFIFIVLGLSVAACLALAGKNLARHRNWLLCMVMAGIACTMMPVGTVLGVFTILVLNRPSVRALFAGTAVSPAPLAQTGGG